jgi:Protein of unknown function (DUF4012)
VGAGVATFVLLLVLDGFWAGRILVRGLTTSRTELTVAIESIVTGDPEAARSHFAAAGLAADEALGAVGRPSMGIAGLLPLAGDNIDAAAAVAEASRATAAAGGSMVQVARDLGWTDIRIPASTAAGRLDIDAFESALPRMGSVADGLREASIALEAVGGDGLLGPVASGYRDAVEGLSRRADIAHRFLDSMRLVTSMFSGEHRYLVCVPALGRPRSGGGAPATAGVLLVDDGSLELERMIPAPKAIADVDVSLHWPRTARELMAAAARSELGPVDGVILIDAVALQDLVWTIGDVEVDGRALPLSESTTASTLEIDAFLGNAPPRTARLHADLVSQILTAFLERRPSMESFALATAADAGDRHLSIYVPGPEVRRVIRSLGVGGRARLRDEGVLPVIATWRSVGSSHVGALVGTTVRQTITIRRGGDASVDAEVLFENEAGTDPPSVLLGRPVGGLPVGTFAANVSLHLPENAERIAAETSRPSPIRIAQELGLVTVTGSVAVRGGESTTLTVSYRIPNAVRTVDGVGQVALRILPQPTMAGVRYQIRVVLPDGSTVVSASPGFERRGGAAVFAGVRGGPFELQLGFAEGQT